MHFIYYLLFYGQAWTFYIPPLVHVDKRWTKAPHPLLKKIFLRDIGQKSSGLDWLLRKYHSKKACVNVQLQKMSVVSVGAFHNYVDQI